MPVKLTTVDVSNYPRVFVRLETYRMAPGATDTSAIAIVVETLKLVESTILTEPPARAVSFIWEALKVYGVLEVGPGDFVPFGRGSTIGMLEQYNTALQRSSYQPGKYTIPFLGSC